MPKDPPYRRHKDLYRDSKVEVEMIRRQLVQDGNYDYLTVKEAREYAATGKLPGTQARHATGPVKTGRSPWMWPLVALIALLVLVLSGTITAIVVTGGA